MSIYASYFCAGAVIGAAIMALLVLAVIFLYSAVYVSGTIAQAEESNEP